LYHFPGLLAKQAQLPPGSAFSSEESQMTKQVSAMCLHTHCRTCAALLRPTAWLESKAWKTFTGCNALSTLIPYKCTDLSQRYPPNTWDAATETGASWDDCTTPLSAQHASVTSACLGATAASSQKKDATKADGKAHRRETMPTASQTQGRRPLKTQLARSPSTVRAATCLGSDATPEVRVERARLEHRCHQCLVFCYHQAQGLWVGQ